jgi:uncharacterized protein involved in exopolysaccharide biosynthesis/Mrp family chromosome partitioning ATPase
VSTSDELAPHGRRPEPPASPGDLLALFARAWRALGFAALLGAFLALGLGALRGTRFRASATILIERETTSGILGDLAALASLSSAPAAASELMVLESRTLAQAVVAQGQTAEGTWNPLDPRAVGLATSVDDADLAPLALLRRALLDPPPPEEPLVLPPRELHARVLSATPDAPRRLRITFLGRERVRVEEERLLCRLRLLSSQPETLDFAPRRPLTYRGLELELEPLGDYDSATFVLEHRPPHEALEWLRERLHVREPSLGSGLIEIAVVDSDPRRAARTAEALGRNYLDSLAERGRRRASRTVDHVQGLLEQAFVEFDSAQREVQTLQEQQPELLAPESSATVLIERLSALEVERVQIDIARRTMEEIARALEGGDPTALAQLDATVNVGVLADPVTAGYLEQLARLETEHDALAADLLPEHPLVRSNRETTTALLGRMRQQLAERARGLAERADTLERTGQELRARMQTMPAGVRELVGAQVRIQIHRELVPYLVKSLQGAEISRSGAETLAEFVDHAVPPTEALAPDPQRLALLGGLLGLAVGALATLVRAPRHGRVRSAAELARVAGASHGLELARRAPRGALAMRDLPAGPAAEELRVLRGALRASAAGKAIGTSGAPRSIGIVTTAEDELGSVLSADLALAYAREGRRVLLVEADLRRPSQARRLGVEDPGAGLAGALDREAPDWRTLMRPTSLEGLDLLAAGQSALPPGDLLARPALGELLAAAALEHDVVVVDLPEIERAPEAADLAARCDLVVLASRRARLPRWRLERAGRMLAAAGARPVTLLVR